MAVPELGQIRIIPDYFNYLIATGSDLSYASTLPVSPLVVNDFAWLDHRLQSYTTHPTDAIGYFRYESADTFTGGGNTDMKIMCLYNSDNWATKEAHIGIVSSGGTLITALNVLVNGSEVTDGYVRPTTEVAGHPQGLTIFETQDTWVVKGVIVSTYSGTGTFVGDVGTHILHVGEIFELPTNATASLSYNTKFKNKVNTAFSGASYSTLYNTNSQRIVKASWEYINWSNGSSGINDFTRMMGICFGSHIPVAVEFDKAVTGNYENYMFARITKWNQTQMSPSLWKVSAEFTEFI